jgi:hypothetical protein
MPKTPKGIFSDKLDFIDGAVDDLKVRYSSTEKWLLNQIIQSVLPELDIVDGLIQNTNKNINIITGKLNVVMEGLRTGRNRKIVDSILGNMNGISGFNRNYFGLAGDLVEKKFDNAAGRVEGIMRKSLGFNPDGTIKPRSFIDSISQVDDINNTIRDAAIRNIQGGNTIKDFTEELERSILTDENGLGILNKNRGQLINDRYAQYDRAEAKSFADELKMQAFIYSGGKVRDTREFCCKRNGLVFTRDEARYWSSIRWTGKNSGYVPLVDMGGYNCRHSPQWISNRVAMRRRKDLYIDEKGKLVSKTNRRQPPLNKC